MANSLTASPPRATSHRWFAAFGIALLLVLAFATAGGFWLIKRAGPHASAAIQRDLQALVRPARVPPVLPLLVLADYPPEQVWQQVVESQPDAAFAIWLFGPVRSDRSSIEDLILLAGAQRSRDADAGAAYLLAAADVARLSPELSDRERADFMLNLGKKLRGLGLPGAAVTEWRQASILAHYGPSMPALYRATLLHDLAMLYGEVGAKRLAERARENSAQVGAGSGILAVPERIVLDTEQLPHQPDDLLAARSRRQLAAREAARSLGSPAEGLALAELADALTAEGLLHRLWIAQELGIDHPREVQAALLLYHINWLQQERMLAWGLGGSQFTAWEERRGQIESAIHEAWDALELVRTAQSIQDGAQPYATLAQRDWWATRLAQARLLRDPALDVDATISSMRPNNADDAGGESLRLDHIQGRFWRVPRGYVGSERLPE